MMTDNPQYKSPIRPFYMSAVRDTLDRGEQAELQALLDGAREVRTVYGDFEGLIDRLGKAAGGAK